VSSAGAGCVEVSLVQGLAGAVRELRPAQLLTFVCGVRVAVADGLVELARLVVLQHAPQQLGFTDVWVGSRRGAIWWSQAPISANSSSQRWSGIARGTCVGTFCRSLPRRNTGAGSRGERCAIARLRSADTGTGLSTGPAPKRAWNE
jgi:hypothetical protein